MPALTPEGLSRALAAGERGGVYFLYGAEAFLREAAADEIIEAHLDPATRDFNLDQLDASEVVGERLASILETPPMLAEWRVVVIREAQTLTGSPRMRELIESILDREVPGLVLILIADIPERSRAKFYEVLKAKARSVEFAPLSMNDLPGWLMERSRGEGIEIEPEAARALVTAIGTEIGALERELSKLHDYVGGRGRIGIEDIEAAVGAIRRQNRWDWFDLVGNGEFKEARRALPVLLDARESGVGLVLGLGTHLLRIALAIAGGAEGLRRELPAHQRWLASRLEKQARHWQPDHLAAALDDLLRADRLLKSTALSDEQVLDELLLRLEARAKGEAAA